MASGALSKLRKAAGKDKPSTPKSKTPEIRVPDSVASIIGEWHEADREVKTANAKKKDAADRMRGEATKLRIDRCRDDNQLHSSVRLNGGSQGTVNFVQAAKFSKMEAETAEDPLRAEFGDDFDKFFKVSTTYTIDESLLTDEVAEKLLEALGEDADRILKAESVVSVTESLVNAMVLDARVEKKVNAVRTNHDLVKQNDPYFKA